MPYFGNQVDTIFDSVGSASNPALVNASSINSGQIGGRRNLLYNGAMQIAQRGQTITGVTDPAFSCDRWYYNSVGEETVNLQQNSDAPDGFGYSQKVVVSTADADLTNDYAEIEQNLEGLDLQHLKWGTTAAKPLTVSLWVKSSQTGACAIGLYMSGPGTMIGSTFTVNSANTWEYKTVTFAGNTTDAVINDNAQRLRLWIGVAAGSAYNSTDNTSWGAYANGKRLYGQTLNLIGTTSATFQITGVQMEVGSVATEFEHRSYGDELALCQRYFVKTNPSNAQKGGNAWGSYYTTSAASIGGTLPVQMRAAPSISFGGTSNTYFVDGVTATATITSSFISASESSYGIQIAGISSTASVGSSISYNGQLSISAEL